MTIEEICRAAYENKYVTAKLGTTEKDDLIDRAADNQIKNTDEILKANDIDMKNGAGRGMAKGLLVRLHLTAERIK